MSPFQKVIKYCAIAFAALLIVSIISGIVIVGETITGILFGKDNTEIVDSNLIEEEITNLDIKLKYANLEIKEGNELKVDVTSKDIDVTTKDNTLTIIDTSKKKFINTKRESVILYIPDKIFDNIKIDNGAGKLNITKLITNKIDLDLGIGSTNIDYIKAENTSIDTGTGSFRINDGELNNSKINVGVGSLYIKGIFSGNNYIDCGVGSTNIELKDTADNYKIEFNKGLGSIKLNKKKIDDKTTIGNGITNIIINGGIGSINVKTN